MLKLCCPNYYIDGFQSLNIERLKDNDIHVLICDIDNTLVAHDEAHPSVAVKQFIQRVKDAEIEVVLISNNVEERVTLFAKELDLRVYPFAKKPLKLTYKKMMKDTGYHHDNIAVLGDQLLTDMLGAGRVHFYKILTKPVAQKDLTCTKINRIFENFVYYLLEKRKMLTKGKYDDEKM